MQAGILRLQDNKFNYAHIQKAFKLVVDDSHGLPPPHAPNRSRQPQTARRRRTFRRCTPDMRRSACV